MHRLIRRQKPFGAYLLFLGALLPVITLVAYSDYHAEQRQETLTLVGDNNSATYSSMDSTSAQGLFFEEKKSTKEALSGQDKAIEIEGVRSYTAISLRDLYGDSGPGITPIERRTLPKESGLYRHPNTSENEALLAVVDMIYGGLSSAEAELKAITLAKSAGYELVRLQMTSGTSYIVLQPQGFAEGNFEKNPGFGIFIFNLMGDKDIVLEAPHPRFDRRSTDLALVSLEKIPAFALLIAGADRRANLSPDSPNLKGKHITDFNGDISDVAFTNNTQSLFHQVHVRLTTLILKDGSKPLVYQFHSFGIKNDGNEWPDFVLSNGAKYQDLEPQELTLVKKELLLKGYSAQVCTTQQLYLKELSASHNPQGVQTRNAGGIFIHIESGSTVRKKSNLDDAAYSLAEALGFIKIRSGSQ